nr:cadherin-like beta sandwich domain-containing protein [uncultured Brevundimonas sp.]
MPAAATQVTLAWTASGGATVRDGGTASSDPAITSPETFDLAASGATTITLGVTGAGGAHTFTITLAKAAPVTPDDDATFDELTFYAGADASGTELTLSPAFTAGSTRTTYTMTVPPGTTQASFTYDTTHGDATVTDGRGATLTGAGEGDVTLTGPTTTYTLTVTPPAGAGAAVTYTFTITGGPPARPALTLAAVAATVTEGVDAQVSFTVTSDINAPAGGLSVPVTLTGAETFVAPAARTQTAAIAAGTRTATVHFPLTNDEVDEPDATATATIGTSAAYTLTTATATATVRDDDDPLSADATLRALSLSVGTLTPGFASGTLAYTATVANEVSRATVSAVATDAGARVAVTATPGAVSGAGNNVVALEEGANTITITVTAEDGTTMRAYTVTVTRAVPLPALIIAAVAATVTEGVDAQAAFTVISDRDAPRGGLDVSVTLTGADAFVAEGARTQRAAIADGARTVTVAFPITDDTVDDSDATAVATIAAGAAYTITTATATVTVRDDDTRGEILTVAADVEETDAAATQDVTITWTIVAAGATSAAAAPDSSASSSDASAAAPGDTRQQQAAPVIGYVLYERPGATGPYTLAAVWDDLGPNASDTDPVSGLTATCDDTTCDTTTPVAVGATVNYAVDTLLQGGTPPAPNTPVALPATAVAVDAGVPLTVSANVPRDVVITVTDDTTATVRWTAPAGGAQRYEICVDTAPFSAGPTATCPAADATDPATGATMVSDAATTHDLTDLTPGVTYYVGVRAFVGDDAHPSSYVVVDAVPVDSETAALQVVLPEMARAMADSAVSAITRRLEQAWQGAAAGQATLGGVALGHRSLTDSVADLVTTHGRAFADGAVDMTALLTNSSFVLPLTDDGDGLGHGAVVWGRGDYRNLSGAGDGLTWDGELAGAHLGVDVPLADDLLLGAGVSWLQGAIDNTTSGSDYDLDLFGVHPYLGWHAGPVDFWATLGYGVGTLDVRTPGLAAIGRDISLRTAAFGGSSALWQTGGAGLRLKGEALTTRLTVEDAAADESDLSVDAHRLRVTLEASRLYRLVNGGQMTPSFEVGFRGDDGDGRTGGGAELGGGLHYGRARFAVDVRGRTLLGHSGGYEEWGAQGSVSLRPGAEGRGLSFTISPAYGGAATANTQQVWQQSLPVASPADAPELAAPPPTTAPVWTPVSATAFPCRRWAAC